MLHFLIVDSICVDQDRTLSTCMPRSFSFVEMSIVSLPIFSVGGLAIIWFTLYLVEISMAFVFGTFTFMSFLVHQLIKFSRSLFMLLVKFRMDESEDDRVPSSANRSKMQNFSVKGKSFTYRRNSRGPKTEPCGTPAFISFGVDNFPEICTC